MIPYILAQCLGGIAAVASLYFINGGAGKGHGAFASNFYDAPVYFEKSFSVGQAFFTEFLLTFFFVFIIMGATDRWSNGKFAGIAIGLALTLIHLISIPITNTSVNPARSLSQAVFVGGPAIEQLWLFWMAPIAGAILGGLIYKLFLQKNQDDTGDVVLNN